MLPLSDYMDEKAPDDLTRDLAINLTSPLRIARTDLVWAGVRYDRWDPEGVQSLLEALRADRCRVFLTSSLFKDQGGGEGEDESRCVGMMTKRKRGSDGTHSDDNDDDMSCDGDSDGSGADSSEEETDSDDDEDDDHSSIQEEASSGEVISDSDLLDMMAGLPESHLPLCFPPHLLPSLVDQFRMTPYFRVKYWSTEIPSSLLEQWTPAGGLPANDSLHLPVPNPFVPSDLTLHSPSEILPTGPPLGSNEDISSELQSVWAKTSLPRLQLDTARVRVWHVHDYKFLVPKVTIRIRLLFEEMVQLASLEAQQASAAKIFALNDLFVYVILDALNEYLYMANMASLQCDISPSMVGVEVHIYGFNDKASILAIAVVEACRQCITHITPDRVGLQYEKLCKAYRNSALQAGSAATIARELFVLPHQVSKVMRLEALEDMKTTACSTADLVSESCVSALSVGGVESKGMDGIMRALGQQAQRMMQTCRVESLVQGNISESSARQFGQQILNLLTGESEDNMSEPAALYDCASSALTGDICIGEAAKAGWKLPPVYVRVPASRTCRSVGGTSRSVQILRVHPRSPKERNVCVEVYFDIGEFDVYTLATTRLIEIILEEPYFDHLRTKQQVRWTCSCVLIYVDMIV